MSGRMRRSDHESAASELPPKCTANAQGFPRPHLCNGLRAPVAAQLLQRGRVDGQHRRCAARPALATSRGRRLRARLTQQRAPQHARLCCVRHHPPAGHITHRPQNVRPNCRYSHGQLCPYSHELVNSATSGAVHNARMRALQAPAATPPHRMMPKYSVNNSRDSATRGLRLAAAACRQTGSSGMAHSKQLA